MRRGVTLLELLISLTIVVVVTMAASRALITALSFDSKLKAGREVLTGQIRFEQQVTDLLHHAWLASNTTNKDSYFIGGTPSLTANAPGLTGALGNSTPGASTGSSGSSGGDPNTITFTAAGLRVPAALLASNDDFETNNQNFGPQGGIAEVSISTTPVGANGQGTSGVFQRVQKPADSDPTQGGNEELLSGTVTQLGFEFFDGNNWQTSWDSRSQTAPGRLPSAVKVTYRFSGDNTDRVFIVQIPASDVTYADPVTVTG